MLRLPTITGRIVRRILVNYRVDRHIAQRQLPAPLVPKLVNGHAIAGICLIRLESIRPAFVPLSLGIDSENAAHRFAVEWTEKGTRREGVYIPRRDSSSRLNALAGGRLFPGLHHHARFDVRDDAGLLTLDYASDDGSAGVNLRAHPAEGLPANSVFTSLAEASTFFEGGALGFSESRDPNRLDGVELRCKSWSMNPLAVDEVRSSYFDDEKRFPKGSIAFDCALIMRNIEHEWHAADDLCCIPATRATEACANV